MKLNVKKFIFGITCFIALVAICLWRMPLSVQTNINSLVEINNTDWPVDELTNKFSNVVNIVIKSKNLNTVQNTANDIQDILATDEFKDISVITTDLSVFDTINQFNIHKNSFLSKEYRSLLKH
jgi:negative regulator of replication initiation